MNFSRNRRNNVNETPYIPQSSIPPMPSASNPIHLCRNNRLKKMYLKDDHVYLSDSEFSEEEEDIQFPYNTTVSKYHKNGVLDNLVGRKKTVTFVMPKKDAKVLRRAKKYAKKLDSGIGFGAIKIPLDPLVGFIPGIGDFAGIFLGLGFVAIAQKAGLSKKVYSKMLGNLVVDSAIGFIPALGDVADFFHKANLKNYKILEKYLIKRSKDFTKMINGELDPQAFYRKYKSFVSHHKKDVRFIHENLGIPLPSSLDAGNSDPVPGFIGDDEELEDIENTNGLYVVTNNNQNQPVNGGVSSRPPQQEVVVTDIETSDNGFLPNINSKKRK